VGAQYAAYEPLPGAHINPDLTMGENIADMGGVLIAYDAYKLSLGGKPAPVIDGYTGDQRFFLAWAQVWRNKIRDEALRQRLVTDSHSPNYYRANGAVRNSDAFFTAFGIKPGDKMYLAPADRVRIW
jgi:putative endopeptidase